MSRISITACGSLHGRRAAVRRLLSLPGPRARARARTAAVRLSAEAYRAILGPLPRLVGLETINRCNGHCAFCPASVEADTREPRLMPMSLIERIVGELGRAGYADYLALYGHGEPLLDPRIVDICALARREVPGAFLTIATNGTRLTPALYRALMAAGLDKLLIDSYGGGEVIAPVRALVQEIDADPDPRAEGWRRRTQVALWRPDELRSNRAGDAPNRRGDPSHRPLARATCAQPFFQVTIQHDGTVIPCCADVRGELTIGGVGHQTLREVWTGAAARALRRRLQREGRGALPVCRRCDSTMANAWVWRRAVRRGIRLSLVSVPKRGVDAGVVPEADMRNVARGRPPARGSAETT